jgi:hypothetical protein
MTRHRIVVGVSLLCAIVLCGISAPGAMAVEKITVAYTCLETSPTETTKGFEDEHCTKAVTGTKAKWIHKEIPTSKTTALKVTNNETMSKAVTARLKSKLAGAKFEIEAGGFQSCNKEKEKVDITNWPAFGAIPPEASGSYCGEYYNVVVKDPAPTKCEVKDKVVILTLGSFKTNVQAEGGGEEQMWVQFGTGGNSLAKFEFTGAGCPLDKKVVEVKGVPRGNWQNEAGIPVLGATLKFTTADTAKYLTVGGEVAEFEGTFTPRMLPEAGVPESPIALTTEDPT